jgi:hypothetical protein
MKTESLNSNCQVGDEVVCTPLVDGMPTKGTVLEINPHPTTDELTECIVQVKPKVLAVYRPDQLLTLARFREEVLEELLQNRPVQ